MKHFFNCLKIFCNCRLSLRLYIWLLCSPCLIAIKFNFASKSDSNIEFYSALLLHIFFYVHQPLFTFIEVYLNTRRLEPIFFSWTQCSNEHIVLLLPSAMSKFFGFKKFSDLLGILNSGIFLNPVRNKDFCTQGKVDSLSRLDSTCQFFVQILPAQINFILTKSSNLLASKMIFFSNRFVL